MPALGRDLEAFLTLDLYTRLSHQTTGLVAAHGMSLSLQRFGHATATVALPVCSMNCPDLHNKGLLLPIHWTLSLTLYIGVIATAAYLHDLAQHRDRIGLLLLLDK